MARLRLSLSLGSGPRLWLGTGLRQSSVMNSFSREEFEKSVYCVIFKLIVFVYFQYVKAPACVGGCPQGKVIRVSGAPCLPRELQAPCQWQIRGRQAHRNEVLLEVLNFRVRESWVQISSLPPLSCVSWGKSASPHRASRSSLGNGHNRVHCES